MTFVDHPITMDLKVTACFRFVIFVECFVLNSFSAEPGQWHLIETSHAPVYTQFKPFIYINRCSIKQIDRFSAWSLLLSTTMFVIKVVKML